MKSNLILNIILFSMVIISCKETIVEPESKIVAQIKIAYKIPIANCADLSNDGKYFVTTLNDLWAHDPRYQSSSLALYDYETGSLIKYLEFNGFPKDRLRLAKFHPNGKKIIACGASYNGWFGEGYVIFDIATGRTVSEVNKIGTISHLEYSKNGDSLYILVDNYINIFDVIYQKYVYKTDNYLLNTDYFNVTSNGKYLTGSFDEYRYLDLKTNKFIGNGSLYSLGNDIFGSTKDTIISTHSNFIYFTDLTSGKEIKKIYDIETIYHFAIAVSKNNKYFATAYNDGEDSKNLDERGLDIWDMETKLKIGKINLGLEPYTIEFGPDETTILASTSDGIYKLKIDYLPK